MQLKRFLRARNTLFAVLKLEAMRVSKMRMFEERRSFYMWETVTTRKIQRVKKWYGTVYIPYSASERTITINISPSVTGRSLGNSARHANTDASAPHNIGKGIKPEDTRPRFTPCD